MLVSNLTYIKKILVFDELESTNDHALSLEKSGEPSGTLIITRKQTQGRGRHKRTWFMDEGDIAMSLLLRTPHLPQNNLSLMPWILALACVEALKEFSIFAYLKWPNDIVLESDAQTTNNYCGPYEKIGGVLVENIFKGPEVLASVLGLGLNIAPKLTLKKEIAHVSWLNQVNINLTAEDVWPVLLKKIDENIHSFLSPQGYINTHERYLNYCISIGQQVNILVGTQVISGKALKLNPDGFLVVFDGQREHIIYAGEVSFSR